MITLRNKNTRPQGMLFDPFFFGLNPENSTPKVQTSTRILHNILKNENGYTIELAAPGFTKEDFNIDIDKNKLTISLSKESDTEQAFARKEFDYNSINKSFTLPIDIDNSKIEAKYDLGVLSIELPLKEKVTHKVSVL